MQKQHTRHPPEHPRRARQKLVALLVAAATAGWTVVQAQDWPEWRGPQRNGTSAETGLPDKWSPSGENVAWTLDFGGRSTPVIHGNRLYLQTTVGGEADTQERLVAVDVDSGRVVWERRFSQYLSDVPQSRAAWASPAVDPTTGNIYMFTVSAELVGFAPDGRVLWTRSLPEEYGAITTHGGRTTSPIVDADKVIVNALIQNWGPDLGRPGNRYFAFDTRTGQTIWVSSPQARHYDTNYSTPIVATVNGVRLLIVGGTDGVFHALQVNTGKPVWSVEVSKRAILNSPLFRDNTVYITHGEENIDTTEMGMVAAVDATGSGPLTGAAMKWVTRGFLPTYSSPVMDTERLYVVDNSAILGAFDLETGAELWTKSLGTLQKGSPVLADGKLYLGTENGKFYILRPSATAVEVLDEDLLGAPGHPEPILASPAVADGRVYVTTFNPPTNPSANGHVYAIGTRRPRPTVRMGGVNGQPRAASSGTPAQIQVYPHEALLSPGQTQAFTLKFFDATGNLIGAPTGAQVQWTTERLEGAVDPNGSYRAPASAGSAGYVKATVGGVSGQARVRVIPALPWTYDFDTMKPPFPWWTANSKSQPADLEGTGVLLRPRDDTVGRRAKILMGRPDWSDYTVEADVRGVESRRQRGDVGLINQRYVLVLYGNTQHVELQPWQAADEMTVSAPVTWGLDTWFHLKFRVQNQPNGVTLAQGKVWKKGDPEPGAWTVEKRDAIGHRAGAPGIYADGYANVYFDNLRVYKNQ